MKLNFLTFGTSYNFFGAKDRIKNELNSIQEKYNLFDTINILDENDLDEDYFNNVSSILTKKREFYLKSWKPYIINKLLDKICENDFILYSDMGNSYEKFNKLDCDILIDLTNRFGNKTVALNNTSCGPIKIQIRKEILKVFNLENDLYFLNNFPHYQTNILLLKNNSNTKHLIQEWWLYYLKHPNTLDFDRRDKTNQDECFFISNRDQPIFQCLLYKYNYNILNYNSSLKFIKRLKG